MKNPITSLKHWLVKAQYSPSDDYWYYPFQRETTSGVKVTETNALQYADVYKCVRVIAETVASLPLFLYKNLKEGGKEKATDHPLYGILHVQPNPEMTSFQFWETAMSHLLTWGNFYGQIEVERYTGNVKGLYPLRPDRMQIKRDEDGDLIYCYRGVDGKQEIIFESSDILHIAGLGFNGIVGYSPISLAREAIGLGLAAQEMAGRFYSNDATPPIVLTHPGKLTGPAHENLKKSWAETHGGLANKFKPAILEEGMDIKSIGMPLKDAQFLDMRKFQRSEICGIYRVPPHMIADLERATFSNIEQQSIEFIVNTIRPWLIRIEQSIYTKLLNEKERKKYYAEHVVDALLRGDSAARSAFYRELWNIGVFSVNKILELENMNPIGPDGDKHFVPLNMIALGEKRPEEVKKVEPIPKVPGVDEEEEMSKEEQEELKNLRVWKSNKEIEFKDNNSRFLDELSKKEEEISKISEENIALKAKILEFKHEGFNRVLSDSVSRMIRREHVGIKRALVKKDFQSYTVAVEDFYNDFKSFACSALHPSVSSYAAMIGSTGSLNCISTYVDNHIKESKEEILKWSGVFVHDTTDFKKDESAIDDCLSVWSDMRPQRAVTGFHMFFESA